MPCSSAWYRCMWRGLISAASEDSQFGVRVMLCMAISVWQLFLFFIHGGSQRRWPHWNSEFLITNVWDPYRRMYGAIKMTWAFRQQYKSVLYRCGMVTLSACSVPMSSLVPCPCYTNECVTGFALWVVKRKNLKWIRWKLAAGMRNVASNSFSVSEELCRISAFGRKDLKFGREY